MTRLNAILFALLFVVVGCTLAMAQDTNTSFRLAAEIQTVGPQSLPDLDWLQGSTPHIGLAVLRQGRPVPVDALTTARMIIGTAPTATNYAQATNWLATNGVFYISWPTIGTNTTAHTNGWWYSVQLERDGRLTWSGAGRLWITETTSTGTNGLVWQEVIPAGTSIDSLARAQIGALSNYVDTVASTGGGTATVAYGVASNTAYRGDWGSAVSNAAAAASSTGTAAYALAATMVPTNDTRYLAALTNAAAFATAAQGAKADSAIQTNHTGNVSVLGRFGLGTNAVTAYPPTRTNAANLLHLVDGGIYLEDKPHILGGGSATSLTAAVFLGYDAREYGRPALWLNSYEYEENGNTYDAASDIYFGKGASFTDASLRWGLSSRPTNQGWGHESSGQFLIYEFPGLGSSGVGGTRFSIFPDTGGIGGPIKLGTETRYPTPNPDTNSTLVVNDWTKSPVVVIEGNTNAGAATFPRIRMLGGTNIVDLTWSNGVLYCSGPASFPMLALGTNAAVSSWPADASTWWNFQAEGPVDLAGYAMTGAPNVVETNNSIYMATVAKAASALQSVPWGEATTNNMTNINWGALGGSVGLTNNQAGVALGGTFTGEHVGNAASLTGFPLSVWANGINYPASPSNTFNLGTIGGGTGGAAGVDSLNALTGAVHIVAGSNITLTVGTTSVTVNASSASASSASLADTIKHFKYYRNPVTNAAERMDTYAGSRGTSNELCDVNVGTNYVEYSWGWDAVDNDATTLRLPIPGGPASPSKTNVFVICYDYAADVNPTNAAALLIGGNAYPYPLKVGIISTNTWRSLYCAEYQSGISTYLGTFSGTNGVVVGNLDINMHQRNYLGRRKWLRVMLVSTNAIFEASDDGGTWLRFSTLARTNFIGEEPTHFFTGVGYGNANSGNAPVKGAIKTRIWSEYYE